MLYEIKVLKAPWPAGAKVGDVIDMPFLPAWAEGKCAIARDDATADFSYDPAAAVGAQPDNGEVEQLRKKLADAEAAAADAQKQAAAEKARGDDLAKKLADAEAAAAKGKGSK